MKLDVPLIQQREGSYHCQTATLLMVMAYFGDKVEYDELLADLEPYILEYGMHNQGAITYLRKRGYQTFFAHHELGVLSPEIENISESDVAMLEDFLKQIPDNEENAYRREKIGLDIEYIKAGGAYSTKLPTLDLIDEYLEKEIPAVLGSVKNKGLMLNPIAGTANHAVVVAGKEGDEYFLNDPSPHSAGEYAVHRDRLLHAWYQAGVHTRVAWK